MKHMALVLGFAAVFGLGLASDVRAQANLDGRISIGCSGFLPAQLIGLLWHGTDLQVTVDPVLKRPISITLEDVTLRMALDASCDSIGCRWRTEGNRLVVEALPPDPSRGKTWIVASSGRTMPSGRQFEKTPVRDVLDAIAVVAGEGFEYRVDEVDVNQSVTVDVSDQTVMRAIAMVVKAAGLKPGSPYTIALRRPGQKPTIIKTGLPKDPETYDLRH